MNKISIKIDSGEYAPTKYMDLLTSGEREMPPDEWWMHLNDKHNSDMST